MSSSPIITRFAIKGSIIHSLSFGDIQIIQDGAMFYDQFGVIEKVVDLSLNNNALDIQADIVVLDYTGKLILPGFVDAHCHAPQYVFTGTGMDLPLLQWLEKYTFPCESKFADTAFAENVYTKSVMRHMKYGTTFASYFATIHTPASKLLVDIIEKLGQRAFVGKVSMDRNSPDFYIERTETSISEVEDFVQYVLNKTPLGSQIVSTANLNPNSESSSTLNTNTDSLLLNKVNTPRILPCITPRFVPTCSLQLMTDLAK
eukprot:gene44635-59572_t